MDKKQDELPPPYDEQQPPPPYQPSLLLIDEAQDLRSNSRPVSGTSVRYLYPVVEGFSRQQNNLFMKFIFSTDQDQCIENYTRGNFVFLHHAKDLGIICDSPLLMANGVIYICVTVKLNTKLISYVLDILESRGRISLNEKLNTLEEVKRHCSKLNEDSATKLLAHLGTISRPPVPVSTTLGKARE